MKGNLDENAKVVQALAPATYVAAAEAFTDGVDCSGYDELLVIVNAGTFSATGDLTIQLEESDSLGSGYADITGAAVAEIAAANDATVYVGRIDLGKRKRYIRAAYDVDDDDTLFGITFVLSRPQVAPVTQVNAVSFSV